MDWSVVVDWILFVGWFGGITILALIFVFVLLPRLIQANRNIENAIRKWRDEERKK